MSEPARLEIVSDEQPGTIRADRVTMRSIDWLDKPFLQRSAFELFVGPKGVGKEPSSHGSRPTSPVTSTATTSTSSTCRQRTLWRSTPSAAPRRGADLTRVTFVTRAIKLPDDIGWMRDLASEIGNVGLIIIDPSATTSAASTPTKKGSCGTPSAGSTTSPTSSATPSSVSAT